ncbi:MAG: polyphosphate kinase 1 [Synechococcales cyanobacterium RM1_1_8]|nr:polyphosphate kinase 1 [Synechococcales cyanobacterium RM1_1_8]
MSKPRKTTTRESAESSPQKTASAAATGDPSTTHPPEPVSDPEQPSINLKSSEFYFNRELSWLAFNQRVLSEAMDQRVPLLERAKFLAIFSSNLDEFFMVRVAGLKQQLEAGVETLSPDGRSPREQLESLRDRLLPTVQEQQGHLGQVLRPQLAAEGIHLLDYDQLNTQQRDYLRDHFERQIFPVLTPLAVDPGHPFPLISNLSLNLAVVVREADTQETHFARVKVPSKSLPRIIPLPESLRPLHKQRPAPWAGVPIEQIIAHHLDFLFPGMEILECHPFRVTRNADLEVEDEEADDLMLAIEQELVRRRLGRGSVVRLEVPDSMPEFVRQRLSLRLELEPEDVYSLPGRFLGLHDLMVLLGLPCKALKDVPWPPVTPRPFLKPGDPELDGEDDNRSLWSVLRQGDRLVHHPYQSFVSTVQHFITQAAHDPKVLAIKITLYRTSGDSPIVQDLIAAAENGKQVVALVELKARFDEENNILWARKLESAGVHVVYGLMGLKTHTKITLVVRQEKERIRRYVHIGTGNYNPKTARLYTDLGLLSCREDLGRDLTDLFNYLTGYSRQQSYRKLLVAPVNLRSRMLALIEREIDHAKAGRPGRLVAKMNSLVDPEMIRTLYRASQAGVEVDLIIRGICCLRPGLPGVSDRIRVVSIIGRLLEHSRIFYFDNDGAPEVFIGSADWMPRNLNRRVEAVVPVEDPGLIQDLEEILAIMLADNRQAWDLQPDGEYIQRQRAENERDRPSQAKLMEMALRAVQSPLAEG